MKQSEFTDLPKLSLFRFENFLNIYNEPNGMRYYNLLRAINLFPANNTEVEDSYTVAYNDTWHLISYKNYNTMDLWWLVCDYNQIKNPVSMPEPGTQLKILKSGYVYRIIQELNKQISR